MQNETNEYESKLNDLTNLLNNRLNQDSITSFKSILLELKQSYGLILSTRFLKGLINENNQAKKTHKVFRIISQSGLSFKNENRYYKELSGNGYTKRRESLNFIMV